MYTFTLPIYYEKEFKSKPNKNILLGMNWYSKAHYQLKNKIKQHFHSLVADQCWQIPQIPQFKVHYTVHYKNANCDISNIVAVIEKFYLDGLKEAKVIIDDSNKYHLGSSWTVGTKDTKNPRVEIELLPIS